MARYVIGDHHFGHANIIEYTGRPFRGVDEMDETMMNRYYEAAGPDDVLVHLGDVAMDMQHGRRTVRYFQQLDGDILIQGNHDAGLSPEEAPFPVVESCVLGHREYRFFCTHRPVDIPEWWDGWAIHGHEHNNHPNAFPFINGKDQRVNVSVELLDYRPVSLDELTYLLDHAPPNAHIPDLETARADLGEYEE